MSGGVEKKGIKLGKDAECQLVREDDVNWALTRPASQKDSVIHASSRTHTQADGSESSYTTV